MPGREEEQLRARHAYDAVEEARRALPRVADFRLYVSYLKGLPATMRLIGLGQTLATLRAAGAAKAGDPHTVLCGHVQAWLCRDDPRAPYRGQADVVKAIIDGSEAQYRWALLEALAWCQWAKALAEATLHELEQTASKEAEGGER